MRIIKQHKKLVVVSLLVLALMAGTAVIAGCSSSSTAGSGSSSTAATATVDAQGNQLYVSDQQCLSCHGGSYAALAQTTASLGDWNPHDSVHGGYNSCQNCHAADTEITDNECDNCHEYQPAIDGTSPTGLTASDSQYIN
jgi:hypothetical protein